jgi:hypothetical protein
MNPLDGAFRRFVHNFDESARLHNLATDTSLPAQARPRVFRELEIITDKTHAAFAEVDLLTDGGAEFAAV